MPNPSLELTRYGGQLSSNVRPHARPGGSLEIARRILSSLRCHGQRLGRSLVRDAELRILQAADVIGIRGMTV